MAFYGSRNIEAQKSQQGSNGGGTGFIYCVGFYMCFYLDGIAVLEPVYNLWWLENSLLYSLNTSLPQTKIWGDSTKTCFSALCLDHPGNEDVPLFPKEAEGLFICFVVFAGIRKNAFEAILLDWENSLKQ